MASKIVSVRFPDAELAELQARAARADLGVSEYVRRAALGDLDATPSPATSSPPSKQSPLVGKVPPSAAAATPSPAPSPESSSGPAVVELSPPAADDLEAKVEARAQQLYGRGLTRRQAATQARRELA